MAENRLLCNERGSSREPRERSRRGGLLGLVAVAVALLVPAAPALAKELTGPFAAFKQCPRFTQGVNFCVSATIEGGGMKIGNGGVAIVNPIILQGGYERNEEKTPVTETFHGALNGETLSNTPQPIPGGLAGLINCEELPARGFWQHGWRRVCKAIFQDTQLTGLSSTLELAGPPSSIEISSDNLINEEGISLSLPVKIHLENPLLGRGCYIGSDRNPIVLNLTDGATQPPAPPISGKLGNLDQFEYEGYPYIEITNNTQVDDAFAVPKARDCGGFLSFLIDPLINAKLGLPSEPGHNAILQNGSQKLATAEDVIALEK